MSSLAPLTKAPISPEQPVPRRNLVDGLTRVFSRGNLISQIGIIITGSIVRLTGSGLGCSDWPLCQEGSLFPVEPTTWHPLIEMGNRTLTTVLLVFAIGLALLVTFRHPTNARPKSLHYLAYMPLALVIAQIFIGGFSVWLDLAPVFVSLHYLVSAALVAVSVWIDLALVQPDVRATPIDGWRSRALAWALGLVGTVLLILGTIVTGAGPHGGDSGVVNRFAISIFRATQMHSISVWVFIGLCALLWLHIRKHEDPVFRPVQRAFPWLVGVVVLQGIIGYTQYFLNIPAGLVGLHVAGSALFIAVGTWVIFTLFTRRPIIALVDIRA